MIGRITQLRGDRQLGRLLIACAVALSVLVAACGGDASTPAQPSPPPSPSPTPSPTGSPSIDACTPIELVARVTFWEAAGGHRIAHVELTTTGPTCAVSAMAQPQLVEGHGAAIIDGKPPAASPLLAISAGDSLGTLVQADNYCGPVPAAPISVGFVLTGGVGRIVALPVALNDTAGVPPCLGVEGSAGSITMQAWAPSGPSAPTTHETASTPPVSSSPAGPDPAVACKPTDQDKYVWGPSRLAVQAACVRVTGTVDNVRREADGDVHILLALDPASRWLLTPANQGEMLGDLVVETVCVKSPSGTQAAAEALCATDPDPFPGPFPVIGQAVWMEGRYVLDLQHDGWAELHPLYRWGNR